MSLKQQGEAWQERVFRMIVFFAVLGCCALGFAAYLISNTFREMFPPIPDQAPVSTTTSAPAK